MYLSYSGHKAYRECPRQYWHRYIDKTKLPTPDNRVNALYGSVVGVLFEVFYRDKIWLRSGVSDELTGRMDVILEDEIKRSLRDGAIDWADPKSNYKSKEALRKDVLEAIPRGIEIIRHHRLLGPTAEAEVVLDRTIEGHKIGGRADFILRRVKPHSDLLILDGKGSRHRDKYVDPRQLWWYAMLYRDMHGTLPDKLGFVFWRQEPAKSLDWVGFDNRSLDDLLANILGVVRDIEDHSKQLSTLVVGTGEHKAALDELFPTFLGGKCNLCAYRQVCHEGASFVGRRDKTPKTVETGVDDIGFDGGPEQ